MGAIVERVGYQTRPYVEEVSLTRALEYAKATNDEVGKYVTQGCVPPVFAVVPTSEAAATALRAVVPEEHLTSMLHVSQDIHLFEPLRPGKRLVTVAEVMSTRSLSAGSLITTLVRGDYMDGPRAVEMYSTVLVLGLPGDGTAGALPPDHQLMRRHKLQPLDAVRFHIDEDQTYRYAKASGDFMPVHVDENVARSLGMPGIIVHGLCAMAMCGNAVLNEVANGDPRRVRRLAVRFVRPVFPGNDVEVSIYSLGREEKLAHFGFTAFSSGRGVINDGRIEVSA